MKIRFDLGIEDLVAFAQYHNDHSPFVRRVRLVVTLLGVMPFLVLPVFAPHEYRLPALAAGAAAAAVVAFRMPRAYARASERQVRKLYAGRVNEGVFGAYELELTADSLVKRTSVSESSTRLAALGPVRVTADYAFIYATPVTAFVIPRHAVTAGDFDRFVDEVKQRVCTAYF